VYRLPRPYGRKCKACWRRRLHRRGLRAHQGGYLYEARELGEHSGWHMHKGSECGALAGWFLNISFEFNSSGTEPPPPARLGCLVGCRNMNELTARSAWFLDGGSPAMLWMRVVQVWSPDFKQWKESTLLFRFSIRLKCLIDKGENIERSIACLQLTLLPHRGTS